MPDRSSEIDATVLQVRSQREHAFDTVGVVDGEAVQACLRCGRLLGEVANEDPRRPCRGFV